MKKTLLIIFSILSCLLVGFISGKLQADSLATWYPVLNKSPLTPPNLVFPIAWTFLYICMGLSIGLIVCRRTTRELILIGLFSIQIALNFLWSFLFFHLQNPILGLITIILLEIIIIIYAIKAYPVAKFSSLLFVPYILWVSFAAYLNLYIVLYN